MKSFCGVCNKMVDYIIEDTKCENEVDRIVVIYDGKVAKCIHCGEELFVDEVEDYNQIQFEAAYKRIAKTITIEEINEILLKYNITKRNLPLLLGWGEITITRYLDGKYIPSKKNSDELKKILNSPDYYYSLLEDNKDKISEIAYKKSKSKIESLLGICNDDQMIIDVSDYIIKNNPGTTNMVLQKLLYYTEMFYELIFKKKLFNSKCSAWKYGPVFGKIYYIYKSYKNEEIEYKKEDDINISSNVKEIIDEVIKCFGFYNGNVLSYFTHQEKPWIDAYDKEDDTIEYEAIEDYANSLIDLYKINDISIIKKYSQIRFEEYLNR